MSNKTSNKTSNITPNKPHSHLHPHRHSEHHFQGAETIRRVVIGASDGLTVPFALMAGIVGAVASSRVVIVAGLSEIAAGAIAMGLGGYLAERGAAEHYAGELARENQEVIEKPDLEKAELTEIFSQYGLSPTDSAPVVEALAQNPKRWVDFMMRFELGLEKPNPGDALRSAVTIALSYIVGGLIPLSPYFVVRNSFEALKVSTGLTLFALFLFGYFKGRFVGTDKAWKSALQTFFIGGLAGGAAFVLARLIR